MREDLILGSIVKVEIENNEYEIMIVSKDLYVDDNNKIDYAGVVYPYGYVEGEELAYFNKELIKSVVYSAPSDKAVAFYESLIESYNKEFDD